MSVPGGRVCIHNIARGTSFPSRSCTQVARIKYHKQNISTHHLRASSSSLDESPNSNNTTCYLFTIAFWMDMTNVLNSIHLQYFFLLQTAPLPSYCIIVHRICPFGRHIIPGILCDNIITPSYRIDKSKNVISFSLMFLPWAGWKEICISCLGSHGKTIFMTHPQCIIAYAIKMTTL